MAITKVTRNMLTTGIVDNSNATAITIDSSENVGIGNTNPSDFSADANNLVIGTTSGDNGITIASGASSGYGSIYFADATTANKVFAGFIRYQQNQSDLTFGTNEVERMRIDSSGNVGIGTTSPSRVLHTQGSSVLFGNTSGAHEILFGDSAHRYFKLYTPSSPDYASIRTGTTDILVAHSDGKVGIGTTSPSAVLEVVDAGTAGGITSSCTNSSFTGVSIDAAATRNTANASYRLYQGQRTGTAVVFSVNDAGNVQNTNNSFTGLSDQRLKINIADAGSQWDDIKALKVRTYQWGMGNTGQTQLGVISQEVEAAGMNGLVEESPADEYHIAYDSSLEGENIKAVKYSVLYMKAVKALQEAMTKIEALEARVTTLEG